MRLPRVLPFPLGYKVKLIWLTHKEFSKRFPEDLGGVAFYEYQDDRPGGEMYFDHSRSLEDLFIDSDHELGHVLTEWLEHWRKWCRLQLKTSLIAAPKKESR